MSHPKDELDVELTIKDLCPEYEVCRCIHMSEKIDSLIQAWGLPPYVDSSNYDGYDFALHLMEGPLYTNKAIRAVYLATIIKIMIEQGDIVSSLKKGGFHTTTSLGSTEEWFKSCVRTINLVLDSHGLIQSVNFNHLYIDALAAADYTRFSFAVRFSNFLGSNLGWMFNGTLLHDLDIKDSIDKLVPYYEDLSWNIYGSQCENPLGWFAKVAISVMNSEALRLGCGS
jgi:hypothetical protein